MRIDDSDTFRIVPDATESIIETLQIFGLNWDGPILFQSNNQAIYQEIINKLIHQDLVYPCTCTRKSLALNKSPVYPGICLKSQAKKNAPHALRIKSKNLNINFTDEIQGYQVTSLMQQYGDFIVKRKDDIIAYQLAVVIDDQQQNISHIVRGFDLLDSTPKQIFLQQILGYTTPSYCHIPVIIDQQGNKLSKQTFAQAIAIDMPAKTMFFLLNLLQQNPPFILKHANIKDIINWAIENWNPMPLKNIHEITREIS